MTAMSSSGGDAAVYMDDVAVVKTPDDVNDGVDVSDVA